MKNQSIRFEDARTYSMTVAEAWRLLADTDHLNRTIGLPSVEFSALPDTLVRRARAGRDRAVVRGSQPGRRSHPAARGRYPLVGRRYAGVLRSLPGAQGSRPGRPGAGSPRPERGEPDPAGPAARHASRGRGPRRAD